MRIYYVHPVTVGPISEGAGARWEALCARAQALGFDTLLTAPLWVPGPEGDPFIPADPDAVHPALAGSGDLAAAMTALARICREHKLSLMVDLPLDRAAPDSALARAHPEWYGLAGDGSAALDPRPSAHGEHRTTLAMQQGATRNAFIDRWAERLGLWVENGVAGFRCLGMDQVAGAVWRELMEGVRAVRPDCRFLAWTPGLNPAQLRDLAGAGFDAVFASLPWWDYRAPWLAEEFERLRAVAPVIAPVEAPYVKRVAAWRGDAHGRYMNGARAVWTAAAIGDGLFVPMGFEDGATDTMTFSGTGMAGAPPLAESGPLHGDVAAANHWLVRTAAARGPLHSLSGPQSGFTTLFRGDGHPFAPPEPARASARLVVLNPDDDHAAAIDWALVRSRLPDGYARLDQWDADRAARDLPASLAPGAILRLGAARPTPVRLPGEGRLALTAAMREPRVVIERVTPAVDDGAHPVKRVAGEPIEVQADAFMDGHDHIAVALLWRAADEKQWQQVPMALINNDRFHARFVPTRIGRHYFAVQAWYDVWDTYREGLRKKHEAGVDISLETAEGRALIAAAIAGHAGGDAPAITVLRAALAGLGGAPAKADNRGRRTRKDADADAPAFPPPTPDQVALLLADETAAAMHAVDERPFARTSAEYPVTVDRPAARFASWYEIFPRSQSNDPQRHGTFDDVIATLPRVRAMGFDTLYFPPIHPIGARNRKGRNNSLTAGPGDPGSPYAIGAESGGHDAIHPELGTLDDFRRLLAAARRHGLEIALDFAIQCSPDHPWLKDHPDWFDWRPDGSIKYAENPPKKYQDIVNVDFYGPRGASARQAPLWRALRDVVMFWANEGVRVFRVDNPHTKPLPFWEWLIADVQSRYPDAVFLAEAFTRPKMMYRLAKVGFTQSYTYFTWRDTKADLTEYLTELNQPPQADFFRPHFFVNTPDINPRFLQNSGRAGFLIRAALAATLSGLWGVYSGFELCEAAAVPGKEEYLDSEKYEIRARNYQSAGNIVAEITRLNQLRRANPALHTHLGLRFHPCYNDQVIFYSKATPQRDNVIFVAVSVDPFAAQSATVEMPLWDFGLPDDGTLYAEDLMDGSRYTWHGRQQNFHLHPGQPFRIWRVTT